MNKSIFLYFIISIVLMFSMGCKSNVGDVKNNSITNDSKIATTDNSASREDIHNININQINQAKSFILNSEKLFSHDFDYQSILGYWGSGAVYKLKKDSNINDLENKLSKYFDQRLIDYVLYTHEILIVNAVCGFAPDNDQGRYYVNPNGTFSIVNQTKNFVEISVPYRYKGLDEKVTKESYGTYTLVKQNNGLLITKISQEFNDSLYKEYKGPGLRILPISYIEAFQKMQGTWLSRDFKKAESNGDILGTGTSVKLDVDFNGISGITIITASDKTKGYVARVDTAFYIKDATSGEFDFDDDGFGHSGRGTVRINKDVISININITKTANKNSLWSIHEGDLQLMKQQ